MESPPQPVLPPHAPSLSHTQVTLAPFFCMFYGVIIQVQIWIASSHFLQPLHEQGLFLSLRELFSSCLNSSCGTLSAANLRALCSSFPLTDPSAWNSAPASISNLFLSTAFQTKLSSEKHFPNCFVISHIPGKILTNSSTSHGFFSPSNKTKDV